MYWVAPELRSPVDHEMSGPKEPPSKLVWSMDQYIYILNDGVLSWE